MRRMAPKTSKLNRRAEVYFYDVRLMMAPEYSFYKPDKSYQKAVIVLINIPSKAEHIRPASIHPRKKR